MGSYGFCSRGLVFSEAGLFVIGFGWGKLLFRGSMRRLLFLRCGVCTLGIQTHCQDPVWMVPQKNFPEACLAFRGFKLTPTNTRYDWGILEVYSLYVWVKPFLRDLFLLRPPTHTPDAFLAASKETFHPKRMTFDLQQLISELFHFGTVSLTVVHVKWPQRPTLEICWKMTTMSQYQVGNKKKRLKVILWKTKRLVVSTHLKHISQIGSFPQTGVNIKNSWVATT